jgi:hypothetical protein
LLLSLITTESVQESTEKLPPPVVMTSLACIQDQVPRENYFLQGPCFYGQRRLCLALCILSSLYGQIIALMLCNMGPSPYGPCHESDCRKIC